MCRCFAAPSRRTRLFLRHRQIRTQYSELSLCVRPAAFGQCLRGRGCWRRIAVVLSSQVIPADSKHFQHHAGTVDQWIDAGSTAVPPDDGNFLHFEFELPSQEENLGIKTPAFNLLQREDRLNCGSPESFEAALGVLEFQTKGEAQDQDRKSVV